MPDGENDTQGEITKPNLVVTCPECGTPSDAKLSRAMRVATSRLTPWIATGVVAVLIGVMTVVTAWTFSQIGPPGAPVYAGATIVWTEVGWPNRWLLWNGFENLSEDAPEWREGFLIVNGSLTYASSNSLNNGNCWVVSIDRSIYIPILILIGVFVLSKFALIYIAFCRYRKRKRSGSCTACGYDLTALIDPGATARHAPTGEGAGRADQ